MVLACMLALGWAVEARTQDLAADKKVLEVLYNATGGPSWTDKTNWLSDEPLSQWKGVTVSNGRVTGLILTYNQLTGTIPTQLGNLANLQQLSLHNNQLTGTIPAELGNLANLEHLYLAFNELTGTIPAALGNLADLQRLDLGSNQLTGTIPTELANLSGLQQLRLYYNQLTGTIPTQFGNLANLEWLELNGNQLTGTIPAALGNLASLEWLFLYNNQLTGTLPQSFTNLGALYDFSFYLNPGLCAQDDNAIRAWLDGVGNVEGPDCTPAVRLSINPSSLFEGSGATPVTVTATRQAVNTSTTVNLGRGGSAQEGVGLDYTVSGNHSITIPANATSGTTLLTFTPLADGLAESDENIILQAVVGAKYEGSVTLPLIDSARACAARDRAALEALYNATGGAHWTNNTNWLSNEPLSQWKGVTVSNGCVTELQLRANQLTGAIPTELGNLAKLEVLYLSHNQLTGAIPTVLGNLENLEYLLLSGNELTGAIPTQLGNLAKLEVLWLSENQLTGTVPTWLGNLANLRRLSLRYNNQLTGTIPTELGNLANLEVLELSDNELTGTIPTQLGNLAKLEELSLYSNQLTGTLPQSFTNLGALSSFFFYINPGLCAQDDSAIRAWLDGVGNVRGPDCNPAVRLSINPSSLFEGSGATPVTVTATRQAVSTSTTVNLWRGGSAQVKAGLDYTVSGTHEIAIPANATSGTTLLTFTPLADGLAESDENIILQAVVGTKIEGSVTLPLIDSARACAPRDRAALEALYNATGGAHWTRKANWLSDQPLSNWHGVTVSNGCVTELQLPANQLTGAIPAELGNLENLEYLRFYNNQLTGTIPAWLGNLANLQRLHLAHNQLTGTIPTVLGNVEKLEYLYLDNNQLTGTIPTVLGNLENLEDLRLHNNQLTGTIPTVLGNLENLAQLYLAYNQLTGTIPTVLGNLENLEYLWLDGNQLTGAIPTELGNLENLGYLYLAHNQLTGTIPTVLGNLENLERLSLSDNELTGGIPTELGNLENLVQLYLAHNQLTGTIPTVLGNLENLKHLWLDNNQLTGTLPQSFTNLGALNSFFFFLNPGLCAQDDTAIRAWIDGIGNVRGPDCTPAVRLSINPSSLFEGSGAIPVTVTATRQAVDTSTTVDLWRGGSAQTQVIAGLDYTVSGTHGIAIPANATSGTTLLTFTPLDDGLAESDENIILQAVVGTKVEGSVTLPLIDSARACAVRDRAALEALYNATGGTHWTRKANWLSDQPLSNWQGVTVSNGCVTELQLPANQLAGILPIQLGNLAGLQRLLLFNNQITGPIPPQLGNLANLERLNLNGNLLTGTIPTELGNLANLEQLWLSENQLTGAIPIQLGSLANLELLDLGDNRLTGAIPAELGNLANLQRLLLYNNRLTGAIPTELGNLANLRVLNLSRNQLTGSISPEADNRSIFAVTGLDGHQEAFVLGTGSFASLERLDLSGNQLTGAIPAEVGNLANLVEMRLYDNQLAGNIPPEVGNLALLEELLLHNNRLTGAIPASFTNLGAVEFFSFYGNANLVVPGDAAMQSWLDGIETVQGPGYLSPQPTSSHFVPVILTASGRNRSFFTSELTLTNRGSRTATLQYTYTAAAGGGSGQASETLAPGRQKIVPDAIDYLRTLDVPIPGSGNRIGTLRVAASGSEVGVTVRTTTGVTNGRAGLAYQGVAVADGFTEAVYLCGLRQNARDRSNVAFQNMGTSEEGSITLRATVFSGDPEAPGSRVLPDVTLAPGGFHQYSGLLGTAGIDQGWVKVERVSGTAPFYAYGVINDQANSDGSFIFPVTASSLSGVRGQTLPVIIEHPNFSTELIVTNFSNSTRRLNLYFVADAIPTPDKTASLDEEQVAPIGPGEQWIIPDVVETMREENDSGIGPRGRTIAGAAFFEAAGGDLSGVVIGARTGSPGGGGQYSVFYNAVPYGAAFMDSAWVYALQQNAENRSNLALVNTGEVDGSDSVFELEIYDGDTGDLVNTVTGIRVPVRGWRQVNAILGNYAPGTSQGYVRVRKTSGGNPFLAYGVINDGGAPGQRSDDGAYVPANREMP